MQKTEWLLRICAEPGSRGPSKQASAVFSMPFAERVRLRARSSFVFLSKPEGLPQGHRFHFGTHRPIRAPIPPATMKNPSRVFTNSLIRPAGVLPDTKPSSCVGIVRFDRSIASRQNGPVFNFAGASWVGTRDGKMPEAAGVYLGLEGAASGHHPEAA